MRIEKDLAEKFRHYIEVDGETFVLKFDEEKTEEEILEEVKRVKEQREEQKRLAEENRKRDLAEQIRLLTEQLNGNIEIIKTNGTKFLITFDKAKQ